MFRRSWVRFLSGSQNFFFVPRSCHVDKFIFHITLTVHFFVNDVVVDICYYSVDRAEKNNLELICVIVDDVVIMKLTIPTLFLYRCFFHL